MKRDEIAQFVGQHVKITYVDGHAERVFLQAVGYAGFTIMVRGERYYRGHHVDVVKIEPR